MNTQFSIQRIGLLLRKDWIEYRKKLILSALIVTGLFLICLLWPMNVQNVFNPAPFFLFAMLGITIGYFRHVGKAIHQSKGLFLTLPASTLEKFVTFLIEGLMILIVFQGFFWAAIQVGSWFMPIEQVNLMNIWVEIRGVTVIMFLSSILFFSYVTFRKSAFGIAVGIYFSLFAALIGLCYLLKEVAFTQNQEGNYSLRSDFWAIDLVVPIFTLLTVGVLYMAYISLKRKELR